MSRLISFLILLALPFTCSEAVAADYYVNGTTGNDAWDGLAPAWDGLHGPKLTIQAGINAAADGDTVTVADGTYTGAGNRDLYLAGRAITVTSENGPEATIINCESAPLEAYRGFSFHSGELADSVLNGFTITNGHSSDGGAIRCRYSSPTITNCTITGNSAREGGGIHCWYGSPTITGCTISGNEASSNGGGIFCYGSSPSIAGCSIRDNSAGATGGGIYCIGSDATITGCTISGNVALFDGGGIYCWYWSSPAITSCTISGNVALFDGGGISCWYWSSPAITNCTISGNSANRSGGIHCGVDSSLTLTNSTISGNQANSAGGIGCEVNCSATIANCILWGNAASEGHSITVGVTGCPSALTLRYCDVQGGPAGAYVEPGCTLDMDASNIDEDPLFADAAGGDYRLQYGSPCIDAATSDGAPERDINGAPRWDVPTIPNTGGGDEPWYDIGAYEFYRGKRLGQLEPHPRKGPSRKPTPRN